MAIIYRKSKAGVQEVLRRRLDLPVQLRGLLAMVDGRASVEELVRKAPSLNFDHASFESLVEKGLIEVAEGATSQSNRASEPEIRDSRPLIHQRGPYEQGSATERGSQSSPQSPPSEESTDEDLTQGLVTDDGKSGTDRRPARQVELSLDRASGDDEASVDSIPIEKIGTNRSQTLLLEESTDDAAGLVGGGAPTAVRASDLRVRDEKQLDGGSEGASRLSDEHSAAVAQPIADVAATDDLQGAKPGQTEPSESVYGNEEISRTDEGTFTAPAPVQHPNPARNRRSNASPDSSRSKAITAPSLTGAIDADIAATEDDENQQLQRAREHLVDLVRRTWWRGTFLLTRVKRARTLADLRDLREEVINLLASSDPTFSRNVVKEMDALLFPRARNV